MGRIRERLVLGPIRRVLEHDETIVAWTHASLPDVRAPGVLAITSRHCVLHVATEAIPDIWTPLSQLDRFHLDRRDPEVVRVRVFGEAHELDVELSLSDRLRSRSVGRVLAAMTTMRIAGPASFDPGLTSPLPPMHRSVKHHARRVWITLVGVLGLLLALAFSTPFIPGPGALTAVAAIAVLAREYEWARDLHVWAARLVDRFIEWVRRVRGRRQPDGETVADPDPQGRTVLAADVDPTRPRGADDDADGVGHRRQRT